MSYACHFNCSKPDVKRVASRDLIKYLTNRCIILRHGDHGKYPIGQTVNPNLRVQKGQKIISKAMKPEDPRLADLLIPRSIPL